ncbi:MAG: hypothetical protein HC836_34645 [Richelia sp. RM2_1_2]|nr:hypothetical protein [Richelia sp. RM2_1_2]
MKLSTLIELEKEGKLLKEIEGLSEGSYFKFKEDIGNKTKQWNRVVAISVPTKSEYPALVHFEPEFTPISNLSSYRFGSMEIVIRPVLPLERHPEFKPLVDKLFDEIVTKINDESVLVETNMKGQYPPKFVLEELIKRLEQAV